MLDAEWEEAWAEFDRRQPALPSPAPAPAPARRRRGWGAARLGLAVLACGAVLGMAASVIAPPLEAARSVMQALAQRDGPALAAWVDWRGARPALEAALRAEARGGEETPLSAGAQRYLDKMAARMTEALLARPEALASFLGSRVSAPGWAEGASPALALQHLRFEGMTPVGMELAGGGLTLRLAPPEEGGQAWKLVALGPAI